MRSRFWALGGSFGKLLRLALPLGALALLSTVFLVSGGIDPQRAVDLSDIDIAELTREPRVGGARFAGVTQDDTAITIAAHSVRSIGDMRGGGPLRLVLDAPRGELQFSTGRVALFGAQEGQINQAADEIILLGAVTVETSDGYHLTMSELISAIQTTYLQGQGGVTGFGPAGEISADSFKLYQSQGQADGYVLAFKGNVRLIYFPEHE